MSGTTFKFTEDGADLEKVPNTFTGGIGTGGVILVAALRGLGAPSDVVDVVLDEYRHMAQQAKEQMAAHVGASSLLLTIPAEGAK